MRPLLGLLLILAACGPVDPLVAAERAYDRCTDRARAAMGPTGTFGIGVGSEGVSTELAVGITSDFIRGRDPRDVYYSCFLRETGTAPTRPLIL